MAIRLTTKGNGTPSRATSSASRSSLVPAAARSAPTTNFSAAELELSGDAIDTFTRAVGGRQALRDTLAIADGEASNDKVINCLLDPAYASWSLRRICTYAGITVAELFASYKKALLVQAHIEATHIIASKLPPIVDDVMTRAIPVPVTCPRCGGLPTQQGGVACPRCQGTGQILSEPDLDRQKLALELGRLTNQNKGGVVVQQNVATNGTSFTAQGTGSLEQLQQAVGELLFAPGRRRAAAPEPTIEAAVIDPREPPHPQDDPEPPARSLDDPAEESASEDDEEEDDDAVTTRTH